MLISEHDQEITHHQQQQQQVNRQELTVITNTHHHHNQYQKSPRKTISTLHSPSSNTRKQYYQHNQNHHYQFNNTSNSNNNSPNSGMKSPNKCLISPLLSGFFDNKRDKHSPFINTHKYEISSLSSSSSSTSLSPVLHAKENLTNINNTTDLQIKNLSNWQNNTQNFNKPLPFSEQFYDNIDQFLDEHNLYIVDPTIAQSPKYNRKILMLANHENSITNNGLISTSYSTSSSSSSSLLFSISPTKPLRSNGYYNNGSPKKEMLSLGIINEDFGNGAHHSKSKNFFRQMTLDASINKSTLFKRRIEKTMSVITYDNIKKIEDNDVEKDSDSLLSTETKMEETDSQFPFTMKKIQLFGLNKSLVYNNNSRSISDASTEDACSTQDDSSQDEDAIGLSKDKNSLINPKNDFLTKEEILPSFCQERRVREAEQISYQNILSSLQDSNRFTS